MSNFTFSGPHDAIEAGLATSGKDVVYFEATAPNPEFDPEDYYTIRGVKKYRSKPTISVAYLSIALDGDAYSVGEAWTHERYRRQGIVRRLYDMAWDYARSKGKGFRAGWVQSPLMAKYWESMVDQGKAEAYEDEHTRFNTTGKGWRRIRASNLRPPCDPFEHGYAFIEPSGVVHRLSMSHPKWAEDYLSDHPELGTNWYERIGGLLKHGWIRVANITNLSVLELNTPPKAAWAAVLDLMVDCVRKGMDPNVIIHVDHGAGDSERTSKWRAGDFARKFGGRAYEDALFDAAMSRVATKKASVGKHKLPKLPYAYDALEPHISEETLRFHHDKHHKAYVDGLNDAERAIAAARKAGDFESIPALNAAQAFNAGGHALHVAYWESLTPDYKEPSKALVDAIERDFGSWDAFRSQMKESTVKVRGSGWGVLVLTPAGLRIVTVMNHENGVLWDGSILLPIDAWEHAYYLDYQNDRAAHFDAVFDNLVNWAVVEHRLKDVSKARRVASRYVVEVLG
jgi:superoxide dismutase/GNAT superfamily N-acetyltransferase